MKKLFLFLLVSFVPAYASASTITIDFESAPLGSDPYITNGFEIAATDGLFSPGVINASGDRVFEASYNDYCDGFSCSAEVTISRTDDSAFGFFGADINSFAVGVPSGATVIGELNGGGTVQFGNFGEGDWLNVVSVSISITSLCTTNCFILPNALIQVDDVVLGAAVPVPAAVWLFGSALAGLGWMRRKQTI